MEKYCPNCNRPNPSEAVFCRHCASALPSAATGGQKPFSAPPPANQPHDQAWNPPPAGGQMAGNFAASTAANAGASGRAIASLALTVCGLVLCCGFFTAIPGAILGWLEVNAIKEGRASPKGLIMAQIGLWGGIAVTLLSAALSVLYMFLALLGGGY